jgi:hypothetical protein
MPFGILWPTFALVALIFVVWAVMVTHRVVHFGRNPPNREDLRHDDAALRYASAPGSNFHSLFEFPVLYFALVSLLFITHHGNHVEAVLAWAFVILRAVQSVIHIGSKNWPACGAAAFFSSIVLLAMWIIFFIDMLHAASLYHQAMGAAYPR